ncbi:MAG: InlB B-repeat-containing protein, partial [Clostridia bacterium]|nr:InlB B-repeat-containing protein [Clostridia bacterium]
MKYSRASRILSLILTVCMIVPMCVFDMGITSSAAVVDSNKASIDWQFTANEASSSDEVYFKVNGKWYNYNQIATYTLADSSQLIFVNLPGGIMPYAFRSSDSKWNTNWRTAYWNSTLTATAWWTVYDVYGPIADSSKWQDSSYGWSTTQSSGVGWLSAFWPSDNSWTKIKAVFLDSTGNYITHNDFGNSRGFSISNSSIAKTGYNVSGVSFTAGGSNAFTSSSSTTSGTLTVDQMKSYLNYYDDRNSGAPGVYGSYYYNMGMGVPFYVNYTPKTSALTFNMNGGSGTAPTGKTATYDSAMPAYGQAAPTRAGYTFSGFYDTSSETGGTKYYNADLSSARTWNKDTTSGTTLYARWTQNVSYTISFNANGGSGGPSQQTGSYTFNKTDNPTRDGYEFLGWQSSSAMPNSLGSITYKYDPDAQTFTPASVTASSNTTLFAVWGYKLTLKQFCGTRFQYRIQNYYKLPGETITLPTEANNFAGTTFGPGNWSAADDGNGPNQTTGRLIGWFTGFSTSTYRGSGTKYETSYSADANATLYAVFGFPIIYDANGGTFPASLGTRGDGSYLYSSNTKFLTYVAGYGQDSPYANYTAGTVYPSGSNAPTRTNYTLYETNVNADYQDSFMLVNSSDYCQTIESTAEYLTIPRSGSGLIQTNYKTENVTVCGTSIPVVTFMAMWIPNVLYSDGSTTAAGGSVSLCFGPAGGGQGDHLKYDDLEIEITLPSSLPSGLTAPTARILDKWSYGGYLYNPGATTGRISAMSSPITVNATWQTYDCTVTIRAGYYGGGTTNPDIQRFNYNSEAFTDIITNPISVTVESGTTFQIPKNVPFSTSHSGSNPEYLYRFMSYKGSDGNTYYPGDSVTVNSDFTLTTQWTRQERYNNKDTSKPRGRLMIDSTENPSVTGQGTIKVNDFIYNTGYKWLATLEFGFVNSAGTYPTSPTTPGPYKFVLRPIEGRRIKKITVVSSSGSSIFFGTENASDTSVTISGSVLYNGIPTADPFTYYAWGLYANSYDGKILVDTVPDGYALTTSLSNCTSDHVSGTKIPGYSGKGYGEFATELVFHANADYRFTESSATVCTANAFFNTDSSTPAYYSVGQALPAVVSDNGSTLTVTVPYGIAKAATINVSAEPNATTLVFDAGEGSFPTTPPTNITASYGSAMPTAGIPVPTKQYYDFVGYELNGTTYLTYDGSTFTSARTWDKFDASATLTAVFAAHEYTITYDINVTQNADDPRNSVFSTDQTKLSTRSIELYSQTPYQNDSSTFLGWAKTSAPTTVVYQPGDSVTENADADLIGVWDSHYTVTIQAGFWDNVRPTRQYIVDSITNVADNPIVNVLNKNESYQIPKNIPYTDFSNVVKNSNNEDVTCYYRFTSYLGSDGNTYYPGDTLTNYEVTLTTQWARVTNGSTITGVGANRFLYIRSITGRGVIVNGSTGYAKGTAFTGDNAANGYVGVLYSNLGSAPVRSQAGVTPSGPAVPGPTKLVIEADENNYIVEINT